LAPCFREAGLGFYAVEYPGYAPYTSIVDVGARIFSWLPASLLVRDLRLLEGKRHNNVLDQPATLQELMRSAREGT